MNALAESLRTAAPLYRLAMSLLVSAEDASGTTPEAAWLAGISQESRGDTLEEWQLTPPAEDRRLHALAGELGLLPAEILAVALAAAVELDAMLGRTLAWLQAPVASARPTLGLVHTIAEAGGIRDALPQLVDGPAQACGLLQFEDGRPLPERSVQVPVPLVLALGGQGGTWPGVRLQTGRPEAFPSSLRTAAAKQAAAVRSGGDYLAVRSGHPREAQAAAALVAVELGQQAAILEGDPPSGLGPWLRLRGALPVLSAELAPGEVRRLPELRGYDGPVLIATGIDGSFEHGGDPVSSWRVPLPLPEERVALWHAHLTAEAAEKVGRLHRHRPAHIEFLSRAALHQASLEGETGIDARHVDQAARQGAAGELGTLAQLMPEEIPAEALVVPPDLRAALEQLKTRCQMREGLADALGPSARTRYRPGVRALLVGPSGTGKTLAAGWLATALGMPLYQVDLASVASKYIGETEKNLAQLFARAEHAEVVLLFDEADSLFGKRTEIKESNDRFANQQTNYLLQRIESFDGIAILTSNSRSRFDAAFTRRLDAIIEFPLPGPEERRDLWLAHLGEHHSLGVGQINRIAASCDLAGGHIRSAVLAAAALAGDRGDPVGYGDIVVAVEAEYRKLGKAVPGELRHYRASIG